MRGHGTGEKTSFLQMIIAICQDWLGTNIGETQKKDFRFSSCRMGENRSDAPRSCIPLATIPSFVMPFFDKAPAYKEFVSSPQLYAELSVRETPRFFRKWVRF
jgi:hypothetical protein